MNLKNRLYNSSFPTPEDDDMAIEKRVDRQTICFDLWI